MELLLEVAMEVEFGALRIDQHLSAVVVEVERHVQRFVRDLLPMAVLA